MMRFEPFLLDRLLDTGSTGDLEGGRSSLSLEQIKDSVARDIEALLNTRCGIKQDYLVHYPQASQSILTYGLIDFAGLSLDNPQDCDLICQSITQAISQHEPRLRSVSVQLKRHEQISLGLNFHIQALLVINPAQEAVNFDAVLHPANQQYSVNKSRRPTSGR